jgi:HEAT repeat protein
MFTRLAGLCVLLAVVAGHDQFAAGKETDNPQAIAQRTLLIDDRPRSPIFDLPVLGQQPGAAPAPATVQHRSIHASFDPGGCSNWGNVPVPKLLDMLKGSDPELRRLACDELGARGKDGFAGIAALEIAARESVAAVRRCAVSALGKIGRELPVDQQAVVAAQIVPALVAALADQRLTVRLRAISGLGGLRVPSKAVESALLDCLKQRLTRDDALLELVQRGSKDRIPLGSLAETVYQGRSEARRCALNVITARDTTDPDVRTLLGKLAAHGDEEARRTAALRLWGLEPTPELLDVLSVVSSWPGTDDLARALSDVDSGAFHLLEQIEEKGDPKTRAVADRLLQRIDRAGLKLSALIRALESPEPGVRENAARELGNLGPQAKRAVPALARHLADENELVRLCSAYALTSIGRDATAAVPDLQRALATDDRALRSAAAHALAKIAPGEKSK